MTALQFDPIVFRAYDIRGQVDINLTSELVFHIGCAVGSTIIASGQKKIAIGRDGRLSSPAFAQALTEGLLSTGVEITDVGLVPSPGLYFAVHHLETQNGIMITGSHNPKSDNGLKITLNGQPIFGDAIQTLKQRIIEQDYLQGEGSYKTADVLPAYIERIQSDIQLARPMKVVVDCGSGAAAVVAPQLYARTGCTVIPLASEVDGNFPIHHPDPSRPENLELLIETVKREKADLGVAFDGDGDRVGIVTNEGTIIYPDRQLMLLSQDMLSRHPGGKVVIDVKCTRGLADVIHENGGETIWYKTGHSVLKKKMLDTGAMLAGEMSGHFFLKERWYGFDDGPYAGLRILEILSQKADDSETVFNQFPDAVNTPEIHIHLDDLTKHDYIAKVVEQADFPGAKKITIDGLRIEYPDAWALMRVSNTTPNLVLRFEADTEARLIEIQTQVKEQLLRFDSTLDCDF